MDDVTINGDEKLSFEVRVCWIFLSPDLIELFANEVKLMSPFFYSLQLPDYVVDHTINR